MRNGQKNWQVVEERDAGVVKAHYVWSPVYVDALVLRDRNNDASSDLEERLYVQHDANYNVTAVVSAAGSVTERFVYDPYGKPTFLSAVWVPLTGGGLVAWRYLHQDGRYHDFGDGTGLYHFRNRELSPSQGRWIQIDPLGFGEDGPNLYQYVGNNPGTYQDPKGLKKVDSGVKICWGFQKDNPVWGVIPFHGFITIDGKGYGFFATRKEQGELNPIDDGRIKDTDLDVYPNKPNPQPGEFYSRCTTFFIDDSHCDKERFLDGIRRFIQAETAAPGQYIVGKRDCYDFNYRAILAGLQNCKKGPPPPKTVVFSIRSR